MCANEINENVKEDIAKWKMNNESDKSDRENE